MLYEAGLLKENRQRQEVEADKQERNT